MAQHDGGHPLKYSAVVAEAQSTDEARLREAIRIVNETLPVLRRILTVGQGTFPPAILERLQFQWQLQERVLSMGLYTLSHLPDGPEDRADGIADTLRLCSDLALIS